MPDQPSTILNDKAVESLAEDALDFSPYVQALSDIVMSGSTPLTIGVFGTWGSGKTSLMRMVKEQVEERVRRPAGSMLGSTTRKKPCGAPSCSQCFLRWRLPP